ncbi:hypothetical protein SDC9_122336 [bioreactor metagenome]|uniref:FeoB-associated Cys-rich membrane protein n=1 Tax=bioreactor metagenome TaxID=1076179 RepID=A0A645CEJ9_9ZZZZ
MLEFIFQNLANIIVGAAVTGILAKAVITMMKDRKSRKSSCEGGCSNCPGCGMCHRD